MSMQISTGEGRPTPVDLLYPIHQQRLVDLGVEPAMGRLPCLELLAQMIHHQDFFSRQSQLRKE